MKRLYGRLIAWRIRKRAGFQYYNEKQPYLCLSLIQQFWNPLNWLAVWHIQRVLGKQHNTLHTHIANRFPEFMSWGWERRAVPQRLFWQYMCMALEYGNFDYGKIPDLHDLGLEYRAPAECYRFEV